MLFMLSAAFAASPSLQLTYTVRYDVDAAGDRMCAFTKLCDCVAVYEGTGELLSTDVNSATYKGTWRRTENSCSEALLVWVAPDQAAFHTLRWSNGTLDEWVVHSTEANSTKLKANMKASGQFWIDALDQPYPAEKVVVQQSDGQTIGGAFELKAVHDLELVFGAPIK